MRPRVSLTAIFLDLFAMVTAHAVVCLIYWETLDLEQLGRILISLAPVSLAINLNNYAYSADVLADRFRSVWRGSMGLFWATLLMFLIFFFLKISEDFSRILLGFGTLLAIALLSIARVAVSGLLERSVGGTPFAYIHLFDGIEPPESGDEGHFIAREIGLAPEANDPSMIDRLAHLAIGIDGVIVHCPPEKRPEWAFMLKSLDVAAEIAAPELSSFQPLAIHQRLGQASLVLGNGQLSWSQGVIKRCFDLGIALAAMPVLLPALMIIAFAVKVDSPGPAFFRQERIGLANRKFKIFKFRTMYVDRQDDRAQQSTSRDDPRVTRVGAFLRRTSLDELPQFLNVLLGDMSIVGPRPHAERTAVGTSLLWEIDAAYWHRHVVKPGITGLAQVRGHRGSLFEEQQLKERLNADLEYVANWSVAYDLKIILLTVGVVVHKNAF